jgi:hypothetical protein
MPGKAWLIFMSMVASGQGSAAGGDAPVVRLLDEAAIRAAPILRGREGEDVCTPRPAAWWETAAGTLFGWAFR